jgi:Peptidase C13 family
MADKLAGFGVARADIAKIKADGSGAEAGTRENIERAFARLRPAAGEACFVFVTSHGLPNRGLLMKRARAHLNPVTLSELIDKACRDRPTVVIASGCFSGAFDEGPAMPAANRVILTAARRDRPSFGCNSGLRYTYFDRCVLDNLERGLAWDEVMDRERDCVAVEEGRLRVRPSEPQLRVGAAAKELKVFSR